MKYLLGPLLASLIGATVVLNGAALDVADILDTTRGVVTQTNLHQIRTALELYYFDQGQYPKVNSGKKLVELLADEDYLKDRPASFSEFEYSALKEGEDYSLKIKEEKEG